MKFEGLDRRSRVPISRAMLSAKQVNGEGEQVANRDFKKEYYASMLERLNEMRVNAEGLVNEAKTSGIDLAAEVRPHLDAIDKQIAQFSSKVAK